MVIFKREVTMVNAKERAQEMASSLNEEQEAAIRMIGNDLHRLNQAVMRAVEAGLSVEIIRTARHHSDAGFWGDLVVPVITKQK
jgi:hypothetical protein